MDHSFLRILTSIVAALLISTLAYGSNFDIPWHTVDGGGGASSSGNFLLTGTIGQADASTVTMTGGGFAVTGGFWSGGGATAPPCPADVNNDNTVDVLDLLAVLAVWGIASGPEDINGDGVVDVLDLLHVLALWGPCG